MNSPRRLRLIVVDDHEDSARTLSLVLKAAGHEVTTFFKGADALRALTETRPDAVILDIEMPDVDGYAVAKWIRRRPRLATLPLIAITGYADEDHRAKAVEAGFSHYLVKPAEADVLVSLLGKLCSHTER